MSSPIAREDLPVILQYVDIAYGNIHEAQDVFERSASPSYSIDQRDRIITKACILESRVRHLAQRLEYPDRYINHRIEEIRLVLEDSLLAQITKTSEEKLEVAISEHLHEAEVEIRRTEVDFATLQLGSQWKHLDLRSLHG